MVLQHPCASANAAAHVTPGCAGLLCMLRTLPHLHAVADAADLCRRGVEISRAAFGEEDSRYAVNVNNYALALCPLGTLSLSPA